MICELSASRRAEPADDPLRRAHAVYSSAYDSARIPGAFSDGIDAAMGKGLAVLASQNAKRCACPAFDRRKHAILQIKPAQIPGKTTDSIRKSFRDKVR